MITLQQGSTLQGGRYRIERVLGQGGFGITYLAVQSGLERKVAIKEFFMKELCNRDGSTSHVTLGTEGSRETVARFREKFLKEARNIARLNHPHIVRIHDIFEENGTAYYVMEYAEGGSLADLLKRKGCLSEPDATCYILQVAEALAYIHAENMNHLDVKPANILLNDRNEAILIDFGLSKQYDALTGGQTSTTPVGISEGYAPMEQYKQGGVSEFSPETDIYALGATYFKLLTGKTPPSALDVNEDGVPVDELKARGVSQPVIDLIVQAMEPKKKNRMKDVRLFLVLKQDSNRDPSPSSLHSSPSQHSSVVEEDEATVVATSRPVQGSDEPQAVGERSLQKGILFFILAFAFSAFMIFIVVRVNDSGIVVRVGDSGDINGNDDYSLDDSVKSVDIDACISRRDTCKPRDTRNTIEDSNYAKREWIDLGLSVKWASCNEGARLVSGIGMGCSWNDAKRFKTKDGSRLPTAMEAEELLDKCKFEWTMLDGQMGFKVIGKNGNSIFLPVNCRTGETVGKYWTSYKSVEYPGKAYAMKLTEQQQCISSCYCSGSWCVRLVHP